MIGYYIFACVILLTLGNAQSADIFEGNSYNVTAFCSIVPPGTKLGSIDACSTYYACTNQGPVKYQCPNGYSWEKNSQQCLLASQVDCYWGVSNPCVGKTDGSYVPDVTVCGGWYQCKNQATSGNGVCPSGQIFQSGNCIYGSCNNVAGGPNNSPVLQSACQVMPIGIYFGSTANCQTWQVCISDGSLTSDTCPAPTSDFDVINGNCNYADATSCAWVTGKDTTPNLGPCTTPNTYKGDFSVCSQYYYCDGSQWALNSCSSGKFFDTTLNQCQPRQTAIPVSTCDRCQFSRQQFVNAVSNTCATYDVCANGVTKATNSCSKNYFFNEALQGCEPVSGNNLLQYAANNGACNGAISTATQTTAPATTVTTPATTVTTPATTATTKATTIAPA